ncbi:MAG: monofunctional biosynthetic peptidoglycan transglycosylase [Flavobacteriales bacterium]|nr:monofunctional biosynthetic peptidoglycan transglycosylase [Flavobacteriales bacterium]
MAKKTVAKKPSVGKKSGGGWARKLFRAVWKTLLGLFLFSIGLVIVYRFVPIPVTILQLTRCVQQFQNDKPLKLQKDWEPIENISNRLQLAVVCSEDQKFPHHNGLDMEAIGKALKRNKKGKKLRGASTISQQTAKNVFLWEGRTWVRKGLEVYFTGLIELLWGKERILEVYLNVIEMGDGIYGAQAASRAYFKKDAKDLSRSEAALLVAVLPSPRKYSVTRPGPYMYKRQGWVLGQMAQWGGKLDLDAPDPEEK